MSAVLLAAAIVAVAAGIVIGVAVYREGKQMNESRTWTCDRGQQHRSN